MKWGSTDTSFGLNSCSNSLILPLAVAFASFKKGISGYIHLRYMPLSLVATRRSEAQRSPSIV